MTKTFFASAALIATLCIGPARAEVLDLPDPATMPMSGLPAKGSSMASVQRLYGEPQARHAAVGGGRPQQPPITRWDYAGFSVFFERSTVVDAVVPDAPAEIHRKEELTPSS